MITGKLDTHNRFDLIDTENQSDAEDLSVDHRGMYGLSVLDCPRHATCMVCRDTPWWAGARQWHVGCLGRHDVTCRVTCPTNSNSLPRKPPHLRRMGCIHPWLK